MKLMSKFILFVNIFIIFLEYSTNRCLNIEKKRLPI
jgi:hypothetical protein